MAKKNPRKPKVTTVAEWRGVETFETNEMLLLARGPVEEVAAAFAAQKKLKQWRRDALGETVKLANPSYLVLRLAGHEWSIITNCVFSPKGLLKAADAQALSKALKGRVIYFGNSDTASATEYELFEKGKSLERFRCVEEVEFESSLSDVEPPEDGPDIYPFVDALVRGQGAFAPACSIHFQSGWLQPGQEFTLDGEDEIEEADIGRMDYLGA